jgi:hypothetical protein
MILNIRRRAHSTINRTHMRHIPLSRALRAYTAAVGLCFTGLTVYDIGRLYHRGTPPTRSVTNGILQENAIAAGLWPVIVTAVILDNIAERFGP